METLLGLGKENAGPTVAGGLELATKGGLVKIPPAFSSPLQNNANLPAAVSAERVKRTLFGPTNASSGLSQVSRRRKRVKESSLFAERNDFQARRGRFWTRN